MTTRRFSWEETLHVLPSAGLNPSDFLSDDKGSFVDSAGNRFSPPRFLAQPPKCTALPAFLSSLPFVDGELQTGPSAVFLMRAGRGAFAIWENGRFFRQKIITKYVVRAKQGKAQSNHNRGKRANSSGAGLRARNEASFITEAAELLDKWRGHLTHCNPIVYSAPARLWGELQRAQKRPVVSKRDPRLLPLGMNLGRPGIAEMHRICYELSHGSLELVSGQ